MFRGEPVTHGICELHYQELLEGDANHGRSQVRCDVTASGVALAPMVGEEGSQGTYREISRGRGAETPCTNTGGRSQSITNSTQGGS